MKDLIDYYNSKKESSYEHKDNNSFIVTNILQEKYDLIPNNEEQLLESGIHIYSKEILNRPSKESKAIHIVTATWNKKALRMRDKILKRLLSLCNTKGKLKLYINFLNIYHELRNMCKKA